MSGGSSGAENNVSASVSMPIIVMYRNVSSVMLAEIEKEMERERSCVCARACLFWTTTVVPLLSNDNYD
jgi:hypothetical protein